MPTHAQLPGRAHRCRRCGELFVFARTVATERGRGGKAMPLDVAPNPEGNVAVRIDGQHLYARVLAKDETHDRHAEVLAMPHFATCTPHLPPEVPGKPALRLIKGGAR